MNKISQIGVAAVLMGCTAGASATNGYWSLGYGPKSKSIAGACVAMAFGSMCAASNPGSLVLVGNRKEYGLALFAPRRGFTANDDAMSPPYASMPAGEYESENDFFLIPHLAYNAALDEYSSLGVAIGANGGMNTEYDSPIFQNFANPLDPSSTPTSPTGMDLTQMFIGITYSRKLDEQHSFGITPVIAVQALEVQGLQPFKAFSIHPDHVTNNGHDYSYGGGLRVGWLWKVNDKVNIGASYQTKLSMTKFDDYKGLLADEGNFDVPANMDLGFSIKFAPQWTFAFDFQRIEYSGIKAISNASDLVFMPGLQLLGTKDGMGFGWDDINIYKFGLQWEYRPDLVFRMGYATASDAFPDSQALFNTLAPAVTKRHFALGFGKILESGTEINVSFNYAPNEKVYGTNPNTGPQTGFLEMDQFEIELGIAQRF